MSGIALSICARIIGGGGVVSISELLVIGVLVVAGLAGFLTFIIGRMPDWARSWMQIWLLSVVLVTITFIVGVVLYESVLGQ